jgi:phosphonoacetaldehyde hydrolase
VPPKPLDVKLVVFDWAGTTIDFGSCAPVGAFVKAFASRGIPVSIATARVPMGMHKKEHIRVMLTDPIISMCWRATFGRGWTMQDVNDLYRLVTPMQVESARQCGELTPGTVEAATWLRGHGVAVAATTGYSREAAAAVYAAAAEQGYEPDFRVCADEVPAGRPEPWMVLRAMEATRVYPPAAVVKIGDTRIDIEDGLNAGAWSVGVVDSSNEMGLSEEEFAALTDDGRDAKRVAVRERFLSAGAHATIDSLTEVPALVAALNERLSAGERP